MNISPISLAFKKCKEERRPALLTYTVAGDNTKKKSLEILNAISNHADICEIGFPHNTPIADGGQIQTSAYRAIKNGIKMKDVFQIVKNFKKNKSNLPLKFIFTLPTLKNRNMNILSIPSLKYFSNRKNRKFFSSIDFHFKPILSLSRFN